jgi:hypothetical protein
MKEVGRGNRAATLVELSGLPPFASTHSIDE